MKIQQFSLAEIRQAVAKQLNIEPHEIQEDDDLFMLGLDSVSLMTPVGAWRDLGVNIEFQDLAEMPTIQAWLTCLNRP